MFFRSIYDLSGTVYLCFRRNWSAGACRRARASRRAGSARFILRAIPGVWRSRLGVGAVCAGKQHVRRYLRVSLRRDEFMASRGKRGGVVMLRASIVVLLFCGAPAFAQMFPLRGAPDVSFLLSLQRPLSPIALRLRPRSRLTPPPLLMGPPTPAPWRLLRQSLTLADCLRCGAMPSS